MLFAPQTESGFTKLSDGAISNEPIKTKLFYVQVENQLRLVRQVHIYTILSDHYWIVNVDAITGDVISYRDRVIHCNFGGESHSHQCNEPAHATQKTTKPSFTPSISAANFPDTYNVYPIPVESPNHGSRSIVLNPADPVASPFGWHDTDGTAGPEYTITRGNNTWAQEDHNGGNGTGYSPDGGAGLVFDYPIANINAPYSYEDASITNLFFWNNLMHDVWYQYGFDEPSGNYQQNNYGNGGAGGDFVYADAQDGGGTDNANFAPSGDGTPGRMQMYLWNVGPTGDDGDFDNMIIAHEYGHGISHRLAGGPSSTGCLSNNEQAGEGWSDWFGLVMTIEPGDTRNDARGVGTFVLNQSTAGLGIRPARYTSSMTVNPYTYADVNNGGVVSVPHGVGFIWCSIMWEITWNLIDQYGFDPDIYNGTGGNNIAMQLAIDGLKLQPCNASFVEQRDAILQADQILTGGANACLLWNGFAKRGLGENAADGGNGLGGETEDFNVPASACTTTGGAFYVKVFLEGAYEPSLVSMRTDLQTTPNFPLTQPYNTAPWFYTGTETLVTIPANMVDWVLLEVRSGTPSLSTQSTVVLETRAGILLADGTIVSETGSVVEFTTINQGVDYYVVVRHRNHLDVISSVPAVWSGTLLVHDFTAATTNAFGPGQQMTMGLVAVMFGADMNPNSEIQTQDFADWKLTPAIANEYNVLDADLDGSVQATDFNLWKSHPAISGTVETDL
ncbi:UNVERIFIED_CONTAM: hypothetical protein GTU68_029054 [Idotea baltica]|nr:hypothetical protein [Idotea baltica]